MTTSLATPPKTRRRAGVRPCGNADCMKLMRPTKTLIKDYPRTVAYGAEGKCSLCYRAELKTRENAKAEERHRHNLVGLNSYMARRRLRGIPVEGIHVACMEVEAA
ncbi:hypothetical protein ACIPY0_12365 [Paenarthrobacter nicotinovorans]|uniref:hypothetical protein n=1 Tax=Paenarthrobacter nicotinovorans TaxID=29320 RepID=UPI0038213AC1